jgi:O-antigen ligase
MNVSNLRKFHLWLFYLMAAFPLLRLHWISIVMIALMITGFALLFLGDDLSFAPDFFLPIASVVFPYVLFLPFADDFTAGLSVIQVKLVLVALPLIYGFRALLPDAREQKTAMNIYCVAAAGIVIWANILVAVKGFIPAGENTEFTYLYRVAMEQYSGLHPTYYCAIVYFAAFVKLNHVLYPQDEADKKWFWINIAIILLCVVGGLAAASRATFMAFCLISFIVVFIKVKDHPKRWLFLGGLVVGLVLFLLMPPVQNRLREINAQNMQAPSGHNDNGTNVRSGIYACNVELLKEHWLLGMGTGDVQAALNECLTKFDTHVYDIHNYNTHNEYLNSWLSAGLLGFLLFTGSLLYCLYHGWKTRNSVQVYFMVFILICFFTENYLERQAGVTFYAFIQTLFFMKQAKPE